MGVASFGFLTTAFAAVTVAQGSESPGIPAFPGAEGAGASTTSSPSTRTR